MATQFVPVELDTIEQGEFVNNARLAFDELQGKVIDFVEKNRKNAVGLLALKVKIVYDAEKSNYVIVTDIATQLPKKPSKVTSAFVSDAGGQKCLFSQAAGTSEGDPRQARFADDKGNTLDIATGKLKEV